MFFKFLKTSYFSLQYVLQTLTNAFEINNGKIAPLISRLFLHLLQILEQLLSETALQRSSKAKVFQKYPANLQENTHAEM